MKYSVIKSKPITFYFNRESIHSIVECSLRHGKALVIAIKGDYHCDTIFDSEGPYFCRYGNPLENRTTYYIPLAHFSYHAKGVAIPAKYWDSIKIVTKSANYDNGTFAGIFSKAVITKKITW